MRPLPILFAFTLTFAGCSDSSFGERPRETSPEPVTTTIAELRNLFEGETFLVTGDIVVRGRVTTSDRAGNFYRSFCVQDGGAAMEVMAGADRLHNDYPAGTLVTLRLKGFALGESRGVLQLGRLPAADSGFSTDYIATSRAALDKAVVRHADAPQIPEAVPLRIDELAPEACGTLVRIEGVRYTPEGLSPGTSWAGYKRFTDDDGAEVFTYVRSFARFADNEVPTGRCSLTGILQYDPTGGGRFTLKLRDEKDCSRR